MTEETSAFGKTRRRFLTTAGATGAIALAGCIGGDDDATDAGGEGDVDTVEWVMNPAEDTIDIEVQYQPLFEAIEDEFDITIEGNPTQSYSGTVEALDRAGEGDAVFADTSPGAVPQLGDEIDVAGMRVAFGSELYFGTLVTTADSGIETVEDLEGERVASGDIGSVSGGMAPLWILENNGLDIGNAPDGGGAEDFEWLGGVAHDLAVEELIQDDTVKAAGAGDFTTVPHVPADQIEENFPDLAEISPDFEDAGTRDPELRMLDISPPIPRAPIVVNAAWESDLRDDIVQFMIEAETDLFAHDPFDLDDALGLDLPDEMLEEYDEEGSVDLDDYDDVDPDDWQDFDDHLLWFSGIAEADHDDYQPVADFASDLGIDFGDI